VEILDDIQVELNLDAVLDQLHIKPGTARAKELANLLDQVQAAAKPRALYEVCYVDERGDKTVTIDGVVFTSHVLRVNLDKVHRLFAYVVTCGKEADEIVLPKGSFLKSFWLDAIKNSLLKASCSYLISHLRQQYALGRTATMSPGSGDVTVWPIEQQRQLFCLLGDVNELIGVELTDHCLMIPKKSVSGILFPTELDFHSCQLCHRQDCPSRRGSFDQERWESMGYRCETTTN